MKRLLIFLVAALALSAGVALTLSCAKKTVTGAEPQKAAIESSPIYSDANVSVYRIVGRPDELAVSTRMISYTDPATKATQKFTWDQAARVLRDDAKVSPAVVWTTILAKDFAPETGLKPHAQGTPMEIDPGSGGGTEGGGNPPDPGCGGCWCCVAEGGHCSCSWGCLKECYR